MKSEEPSEKVSKAFSPAGISSFFEVCSLLTDKENVTPIEDIGSRGGGFAIQKGVFAEVSVSKSKTNSISVFINGKYAPEAKTSKMVAKNLLNRVEGAYKVIIKHEVQIPIGAGFGTSAGGALTTGLALSKALDLKFTFNEIGRIAHFAEIKCKTGLGTVGPLMLGGCLLTTEPGPPGTAVIDRIPLTQDYVIVAGVFGPTLTEEVLASSVKRAAANRWGGKTLKNILSEPTIENFLSCCFEFAEKTGFTTKRLKNLAILAEKAGAIGSAQNMVGEAIHAVTKSKNANRVAEAFKEVLPDDSIFISNIDFQGARLIL